ncbi:hypothetical protein COW36_03875 [bacterium (Candidatus Blackallbacteria) CG17_big_fil_post_rev_8_21_14_2_50_48_46]|uniref:Uncharacterized protein n=1 Tax=bacterium (Candidatus Blackallbacteria) CG17_big_fil_post_rev_8_21_14_2_50_48_46 TaxID=2014261 RepID=A0A2M7G8K0_9BACT|nr:MAG: hypothetical protein COW64_05070 [bacterium (Candidatus Blackallbacteria) CG18_big_fil_WC_8_21_14_2_50_49_26]PIW18438.1 MAG: hypothetical protein COW36_03875 [bacterium (Candidatus Blackallbacteria) CG17_big_fil_post_rev_8_21_14_2_50_48_46]PIW46577.1 MAG: hypothetical protein COW20_16805 [bacterium (Candidatus Blackallbacteria) CG13_big_fil_rev_8_21_14_2_50_49_14]
MLTPSFQPGPGPVTPLRPAATPPVQPQAPAAPTPPQAPATEASPAAPSSPGSVNIKNGITQDSGFNPVAGGIFEKKLNRMAEKLNQNSAKPDSEFLASFKQLAAAIQELNPPPDSQLARIVNQFKAVLDKTAEKLGLNKSSEETGSAEAPATPAAPSEAAVAPAEPAESASPEAPAEPNQTEAPAEPAESASSEAPAEPTETEAAEAPAESASSEASAEPNQTEAAEAPSEPSEGSDAPATAPSTAGDEALNNPITNSPHQDLKESIDKLLDMLKQKRLKQDLGQFSETKLQERMREMMLNVSEFMKTQK